MSTRLNVTLSDKLAEELEKVAVESETNKGEVFRKALTLYLALRDGTKDKKLKAGLVNPETNTLETEIIGL